MNHSLGQTDTDHCLETILITSPKLTTSSTCLSTPLQLTPRNTTSRKNIMQTTQVTFAPVRDKTQATTDIARIHSKMTTKRVGGKVVLMPRK
jgi:hypothetical protein